MQVLKLERGIIMPDKDIPIGKPKEGGEYAIVSPDGFYLTIEPEKDVLVGVKDQFDRYIEICGNSKMDVSQWMTREDFLIFCACVGFDKQTETLSDIFNQAIVDGCLAAAEFNDKMEKIINEKG
jgi:hypothetical protein